MISEFIQKHAHKFEEKEEQDIEYYSLFQEFVKIVDAKLEDFLKSEGLTAEQVFESCERIQQIQPECLMCLDWLFAAADYESFIGMMLDFRAMNEWQDGGDEKDEAI